MCFFGNYSLPSLGQQPMPSGTNSSAAIRAAQQRQIDAQAQGRRATILTTPLGDPNFGKSVNRTVLTGFNPS